MASVQLVNHTSYPVDETRVRAVVEETLAREKADINVVVSVAVVSERQMQDLNHTYHEIDAPTDVLSFPYTDPQSRSEEDDNTLVLPPHQPTILGDLAICPAVAEVQAVEKGITTDAEIDFLVDHGMMHLLGRHHD